MLKKFLSLLCLIAAVVCLGAADAAHYFDVRKFGAKGDGRTDDTAAIQRAADAAMKDIKQQLMDGRTVFFPPGKYMVNGQINVKNISLKGEDAIIYQQDSKAVTFYYTDYFSIRVTGLTFYGGKGHVSVVNDNIDKSLFFVDNCRFFLARDKSLETRHGAQSCLFTIVNCEFIRCVNAIDSDCDVTAIRDIWLMTDEKMFNRAPIVNRHGVMTVDNLLGVPLCNGDNQRWIDNYGSLYVTATRFGGEGGGFTGVYNFKRYQAERGNPVSIVIENTQVCAHSSRGRNCLIYCVEVPNHISIRNCTGTGIDTAVVMNKKLDMKKYFYGDKSWFSFSAANNVGINNPELPASLLKPVINPMPMPKGTLTRTIAAELAKKYINRPVRKSTSEVDCLAQPGTVLEASGKMDGSQFNNDQLLYVIRKNAPAMVMMLWPGKANVAPNVVLKHVKVDLDKTPWFLMDFSSTDYAQFAIKIIDEEDDKLYAFRAQQRGMGRCEVNIPAMVPALKGKKQLSFLIYYIGRQYNKAKGAKRHHYTWAEPGSILEINELGFNSKPQLPVPAKRSKSKKAKDKK